MTYHFDGYNHLVRLEKGELLVQTLGDFVQAQNIKGAFISGLGGAEEAELGFYNLQTKQYQWRTFNQLLEVTSLQGTVAWKDNKPALHIHGTFSDQDFHAFGGHIKELRVGGTLEIFLHTIFGDKPLQRVLNDKIGLALLDL